MYVGVGVVFPLLSIDSAALAVHGANPMTSPPRDDPRRRCRNVVVMIAVDLSLFGSVPGKVIRDLPRLPPPGHSFVLQHTFFGAAIVFFYRSEKPCKSGGGEMRRTSHPLGPVRRIE